MLRRSEVPDCMLVRGRVATADVTTLHAHPQLHPRAPGPHAVLAARPARPHVANAIEVEARHWVLGLDHDEHNVRTACPRVESIDGMGVMLPASSVRLRRRAASTPARGLNSPTSRGRWARSTMCRRIHRRSPRVAWIRGADLAAGRGSTMCKPKAAAIVESDRLTIVHRHSRHCWRSFSSSALRSKSRCRSRRTNMSRVTSLWRTRC